MKLVSPVSNDGRGLKLLPVLRGNPVLCVSPVSNDGRGLKQRSVGAVGPLVVVSPVSNDGRGLKPVRVMCKTEDGRSRPSAMTGVD